jgi:hypothetical protein
MNAISRIVVEDENNTVCFLESAGNVPALLVVHPNI